MRTIILIALSLLWFGAPAFSAPHPTTATQPITVAAQETWTWVDFPNAFCATGATTGIGVNFNKASSRVLIYLEAGGACWSFTTCYTTQTAINFTVGYGSTNFAIDSGPDGLLTQPGSFFDRTSAGNPFQNDNYVFVPYCTGDLHAGDNTVTYRSGNTHYTAKHVGYANMTAYLQRIVATFPNATHVTLAGSSAGGYGALLNWDQTQQLFGNTEVDVIDDSGTAIPAAEFPATNAVFQAQMTNWNLPATLPSGCTNCVSQGFTALLPYYETAYPGDKAAFLTYSIDTVLPYFYGLTTAQWQQSIWTDAAAINPLPNFRYFAAPGSGHILLYTPQLATGATTVEAWLTAMLTGSSPWNNVSP